MGRYGLQAEQCKANLNNIPHSANRGKVEFVLYRNFEQCETKLSRLTADELTGGDEVDDFKYKNTIYFNARGRSQRGIQLPAALIEAAGFDSQGNSESPVIVPLLEWECRYPHKYHVVAQKSNGEKVEFRPEETELLDLCKSKNTVSHPICFLAKSFRLVMFPYTSGEFQSTLSQYHFKDSEVPFHLIENDAWISMETVLLKTEESTVDAPVKTAIQHCWASDSVSADTTIR